MRNAWLAAAVAIAAAVALASVAVRATDSPEAMAKRKLQRELSQRRTMESKLRALDWRKTRVMDGGNNAGLSGFDNPVVRAPAVSGNRMYSSVGTPPPRSPGLQIGLTSYDYQSNESQGYNTARLAGNDCVHFSWMAWDHIPGSADENDRYVAYTSYSISTNTINHGFGDVFIGLSNTARAGYTNLDVDAQNLVHVSLHQRQDPSLPYHCWRITMPVACNSLHVDDELGGTPTRCIETLWPRIACSRDAVAGDTVVVHEIGIENVNNCTPGTIYYWRNTGGITWTGPVVIDSSDIIGYTIADCPIDNKVAIAFQPYDGNPLLNIAYHESNTAGYGWLTGAELGPSSRHYITNYTSPTGPQAWTETSCTYDNDGVLHIVYMQQKLANNSERMAIMHWNSLRNTSRIVAMAEYDGLMGASAFNLNLAKVTVGIGDGSSICQTLGPDEANYNYVYVTFIKFGGETPAEQADISAGGFWNGELYLAVSNSGGNTWSAPVNLSNTKTPNCNPGPADSLTGLPARPDSVCRSENWATIGRAVSDIDIFFISDIDAGGIPQGEGTWQMNPVMYLRLPKGTHAQYVCPAIAPSFEATLTSSPDCEYHSTRTGTDHETLTILNLGNEALNGTISIQTDFTTPATLTLSGGVGPYTIAAGGPDLIKTVTMAANNAPEGLYHASISITHNDVTKTSPRVYPIDYFIYNNFFCPEQSDGLRTGVTAESEGSLWLQVESNGRFASQSAEGGLWRASDSSSSIFDASLLVAHDAQGPDTTVYLRFYNRATNGQYGFRALSDFVVDNSAFYTGTGFATGTSSMCTADSVVGIKTTWYFPQNPDSDEFILARYQVYRNRPTVPISDLAIGVLMDGDVLPARRLGSVEKGVTNLPGGDASRKLAYQVGVDTLGHAIVGTNTATRFRAGVAACGTWQGAYVGNSLDDIKPGGGPTDGFLYRKLTQLIGVDMFVDSGHGTDLYTLVALDRGKSIAVGETLNYSLVFASDTIGLSSFLATVDAGLFVCGCSCPCQYDPHCDGLVSDVLDVVDVIARAFRGSPPAMDATCPQERFDVDGSGTVDVLDVTRVVNVALRGFSVGSQYDLNPCLPGDQ
jgi:hypothetical protein